MYYFIYKLLITKLLILTLECNFMKYLAFLYKNTTLNKCIEDEISCSDNYIVINNSNVQDIYSNERAI